MKICEKVVTVLNRIEQPASVLKSLGAEIDHVEVEMEVLNGLPEDFDYKIMACYGCSQ